MVNDAPRRATADDAATVTELLAGGFFDDPVWGPWAFPDADVRRERRHEFWRILVDGAQRYPWVWLAAGDAATSLWIPPGGSELSEHQEQLMHALLADLPAASASRIAQAFELFDAARPRDTSHYYLTLLATDPARRGHGHGLKLLAENLRLVDAEAAPAYLESSNPANVRLYERHGFEVIGSFELPDAGPTVHTMWRLPGGTR